MAKFSWKVFKKGKPIYWIIGAVVLFVIFYLIASGGSKSTGEGSGSSGGGITTIQAGPSDTQIAAGAAISQAQINANAATTVAGYELALGRDKIAGEVAVAGLAAKVQELELTTSLEALTVQSEYSLETARVAAQTNIALAGIDLQGLTISKNADLEALRITSQTDYAISALNRDVQIAGIDAAVLQTQIQSATAIALGGQSRDVALAQIGSGERITLSQLASNERILISGLETQQAINASNNATSLALNINNNATSVQMAEINADFLTDQAVLSVIPTLKKKDRDNALISLATGAPYRSLPGTGTLSNPITGNLVNPVRGNLVNPATGITISNPSVVFAAG